MNYSRLHQMACGKGKKCSSKKSDPKVAEEE